MPCIVACKYVIRRTASVTLRVGVSVGLEIQRAGRMTTSMSLNIK